MKRISILACILGVWFVSTAWAQQTAIKSPTGRHLLHRMPNQTSRTPGLTVSRSFQAKANPDEGKIWELGTYPDGTWAALNDINDFGMAVGIGDIPPIGSDGVGYTHSLVVPLVGRHAGEWMDLGTLGGEQSRGWEEPCMSISNTGLVATHSTAQDGQVHAVAWTRETGMVDLGTLADTRDSRYSSHNSSYACLTNRFGTLIAGESGINGVHTVPVVWTPSRLWNNGEFVTKWQIHPLNRKGLPEVPNWDVYGLNDNGQIDAVGYTDNDSIVISVVWNPSREGRGWVPTKLPNSKTYPKPIAFKMNDKGQITGVVLSEDESVWIPVLWKPLDVGRTKYSRPIEFGVPEGFTGCESVSVNDLGDITGDCFNDTQWLPVHWKVQAPASPAFLSFPGDWGFSWGVNDKRTAVFTYGGGQNCPSDTYGSCGGAVQLH